MKEYKKHETRLMKIALDVKMFIDGSHPEQSEEDVKEKVRFLNDVVREKNWTPTIEKNQSNNHDMFDYSVKLLCQSVVDMWIAREIES